MKKLFKVLVIVLLAVCTVNLTACDGNEKDDSFKTILNIVIPYIKDFGKRYSRTVYIEFLDDYKEMLMFYKKE